MKNIPGWVPKAVKDVALRLPPSGAVRRLLTDERMQSVWRVLLRQSANDAQVEVTLLWWERDAPLGLTREELHLYPLQERAAAAFFVATVETLTRKPSLMTRAEFDAQARKFSSAVDLCREQRQHTSGELKQALAVVANYFEHQAKLAEAAHGPHIVQRSAMDDALRIQTRLIAAASFSLYGKCNYQTVATVMSVGAGADVDKKNVAQWSADIPAYFQ